MTSYLIIQGEDTSIYILIKIQGVALYRRYQFSKHINFFTAERPRFKTLESMIYCRVSVMDCRPTLEFWGYKVDVY